MLEAFCVYTLIILPAKIYKTDYIPLMLTITMLAMGLYIDTGESYREIHHVLYTTSIYVYRIK